jgi:hypothetical protein
MKALWFGAVFSLVSASASFAAPVTVTVSDTSFFLPGVANATTAILLDAGLPTVHIGNTYVVKLKKFHCDQRSNGALSPGR